MIDIIVKLFPAIITLTTIGAVFGLILSVAKKKLHVEKDPRIEQIIEALPGANCGACGLPGCSGYATKIVDEDMEITLCPVGGADLVSALAEIMGVEAEGGGVPLKARVHCHGGNAESIKKFEYEGPHNCSASENLMGGDRVCSYGCLGRGECVDVCPFDAMYMNKNGLPEVILDKCTGCGKCVQACPRDIISLIPENFDVYVMCKNEERGALMKKGCSVGCTGCKLCEKACKEVEPKGKIVLQFLVSKRQIKQG